MRKKVVFGWKAGAFREKEGKKAGELGTSAATAQESAEGPPAHAAERAEDVAAPPRSWHRWASRARLMHYGTKSKFLGCGGVGDGVSVEGREEHAQHFHFSRKTAASSSASSPCFTLS